jgi:hypothetical protein
MVRRHSPVRALRASTDGALVGRAQTRRRKAARLPYCSNITGPAPGRHREPRPKRAGRRTRSCRSSSSSAASTRKPALRTAQSRRRAPISAKRDQLIVHDADPRSTGPVTERVSRRSSVARWSPRRRRLVAAADSCGSRRGGLRLGRRPGACRGFPRRSCGPSSGSGTTSHGQAHGTRFSRTRGGAEMAE